MTPCESLLPGSDFFHQTTPVSLRSQSRLDAVIETVDKNEPHLHVGCVDWPIFAEESCAHLQWLARGYSLDGLDIDRDGIEQMRPYVLFEDLFGGIDEVPTDKQYGYLLIPDVIEHVANVQTFLLELNRLRTRAFALSTPNGLAVHSYIHEGVVYEEVHPDHNCWYSPFTIQNVIKKYTPWEIREVLLVEGGDQIVVRGLTHREA